MSSITARRVAVSPFMTLSGSFPSLTTIVGDATASTDRTFTRFAFARVTRAFGSAEHVGCTTARMTSGARECRARATAKTARRRIEGTDARVTTGRWRVRGPCARAARRRVDSIDGS